MKRTRNKISLVHQMKQRIETPVKKKGYDGNIKNIISTGSTLLDLAISGGRIKGGGIPSGILVEIFGPSGCGKTVLLCELAGTIQRKGGSVMFHDPEARLNQQFAKQFGLSINEGIYKKPDKVPEVFKAVREWKVESNKVINAIFADSLAALSTDLEMDSKEGDKMGGRRAKEFSEELRKTCRILVKNNYLMVCSNQIRENVGGSQFEEKYKSPGGLSVGFYSSLRLRFHKPEKITIPKSFKGKIVKRVIGVTSQIEVYKSSIWKPYRKAPITIIFDYGIDNIRQNLQFIKDHTGNTIYTVLGRKLHKKLDEAIKIIEDEKLEEKLNYETIELWEAIESKFDSNRKPKER